MCILSNNSHNGINFFEQFFDSDEILHCWESLKGKYLLSQNIKLKWLQLTHALPREWKEFISMHDRSLQNLLIQDHHLIKKNQIICLTKLNSNELYKTQTIIKYKNLASQSYFEKTYLQFKLENNLSSSPYCYSRYGYPCFSVQITQ